MKVRGAPIIIIRLLQLERLGLNHHAPLGNLKNYCVRGVISGIIKQLAIVIIIIITAMHWIGGQ